MTAALVAVLIVLTLLAAPIIRRIAKGSRLVNALLTGSFGDSLVDGQFRDWFAEVPSREEQRAQFVQLALAMKAPSGVVADRLMKAIMAVWRGEQESFGNALAIQVDHLIVFDQPKDPDQATKQKAAIDMLQAFKSKLRALDRGAA